MIARWPQVLEVAGWSGTMFKVPSTPSITHEVTNVGSDRSQLSRMNESARAAIGSEAIEAVADRGYYNGEEIVACEQAGITVYLPKPMTSGLLADQCLSGLRTEEQVHNRQGAADLIIGIRGRRNGMRFLNNLNPHHERRTPLVRAASPGRNRRKAKEWAQAIRQTSASLIANGFKAFILNSAQEYLCPLRSLRVRGMHAAHRSIHRATGLQSDETRGFYATDNSFDQPLDDQRADFEVRLAQALAAGKAKGKTV